MIEQVKRKYLPYLTLIGIILLALGFRIFLFRYRYAVKFDEPHYLQLAASSVLYGFENILHPHWSPMYPFLIAIMSLLVRNFELAGRLVSAISGSLVILPVFFLTKNLFGKKTACLSAILIALYPVLAFSSTNVLTESTYMLLSISGIAVGWLALKKGSKILGLVTGLFFGMSYLTRPEGIGCLIVFLWWGITLALVRLTKKKMAKEIIIVLLFSAISCLLISSPYLIYLRKEMGKWSLSQKWDTGRYAIGSLRKLSEDNKMLPVDMGWHMGNFSKLKLKGKVRDSFAGTYFLKRVAKNYYDLVKRAIPSILTGSLFILLILGFLGEYLRKDKIKFNIYLLSHVLFFWFILIPFFISLDRYMIPILPICFVWIGNGLNVLYKWLILSFRSIATNSPKFLEKTKKISILVIVLFLLIFSYLPEFGKIIVRDKYSRDFWADPIELRKAGLWLKTRTNHPPVLMSYNKAIDFYAGQYDVKKGVSFADNTFDRILKYAYYRGVEYIVVDERYKEKFPQLNFLLEKEIIPPELELVYEDNEMAGLKTMVFKLLSSE